MSQDNVEIVKKVIPPAGTDFTDLFRDDVAWSAFQAVVEPSYVPNFKAVLTAWGQQVMEGSGPNGVRRAFLDWLTPWASYYEELGDVFAVGDDRVVVLGRHRGYRLDTGAEVVSEVGAVYLVRNGKIARVEYYGTREEALEAVGLSEQDAHADS